VSRRNDKGYVRGYDVRTGKRLWIFHTIPQPGEAGNETWLKDSWAYTGNAGNWGQMSGDPELGYVYLATEMPTGDYYGGHRPGANLFSDCIVAIEVKTGKRIWYFQAIHHDMWDWDFPCAPIFVSPSTDPRLPRRKKKCCGGWSPTPWCVPCTGSVERTVSWPRFCVGASRT